MADLEVEPGSVDAAGVRVAVSGEGPGPPAGGVIAPAPDPVSVRLVGALAARIGEIGAHSAMARQIAVEAGAALRGGAGAYAEQERLSALALRGDAAGVGAALVPEGFGVPGPHVAPEAPGMPEVVGAPPASGKAIAQLIHTGPGPGSLYAAADDLRGHGEQLRTSGAQLQASASALGAVWRSAAGGAAGAAIVRLANWYTGHATKALDTAGAAEALAGAFVHARAVIPRPEVFEDLERRLRAAYAANGMTGRYTVVIAGLHSNLAAVNVQAHGGYEHYASAGAAAGHALVESLVPPPHIVNEPAVRQPSSGLGDAGRDGTGRGDTGQAGADTRRPGEGGPGAAAGNPLPDEALAPAVGQAGALVQGAVPAVAGAIAGSAGGVLGALAGGANKAVSGIIQAGQQALGGLSQGLSAAAAPSAQSGHPGQGPGGGEPAGGQARETPGDGPPDGGRAGQVEPSSGVGFGDPGPLTAPATGAVPVAAAPATASIPSASAVSPAGGGPAGGVGGGFVPPLLGGMGPRDRGESEDDKRLYPPRRLKVESPPNAEPVKGRREPRPPSEDPAGG